jgi:two-component system chemotaxis sensor kinase CheA
MSELNEAAKEFLIESHENLDQLDTDLVGLESAPAPGEALGRIFRTLHTIKGSCSFLGFSKLEEVAHAGENLLGKLRDGKLTLDPPITQALLQMVDAIRRMLASVENLGHDGDWDERDLIRALNQLAASDPAWSPAPPAPSAASFAAAPEAEASAGADGSAVYDASVRIHVDLLDKLMSIAGEIVLARNQILQYSQRQGDPSFQNTCRQLNLITTELQEHVMKTRLQPVATVLGRFPRLVRDAASACGKKVRLETEGSETELDKTLIEAIRDPLTHLVRNAIDHGIEAPERRRSIGKPEEGCIRLRAYHEGGQVNIEISDDGAGIDPDRIRRRAVDQQLVTHEQASRMGEQTVLGLIFLPGFSTAPAVTTLSGRGVGMDVVKTNIERIGGAVNVQSTIGKGSTVQIRIPLTLAIIKVLVVTSSGERYAIPQVSIVELVSVDGEKAKKAIQRVHGAQVYRYRDRLLPLVDLRRMLQLEGREIVGDDAMSIVVLQAANQQFGLVVDEINDTQEIVVKPLWKHLKGLACFAGGTVMGDGRVALILDVFGLAQRACAIANLQELAAGETRTTSALAEESLSVLLVEGRDRSRMAIPLDKVDRLEEFRSASIERIADGRVVQYRGRILPLLDVESFLGANPAHAPDAAAQDQPLQVVVCSDRERSVGLVVERILDIVHQNGESVGPASRLGVAHTAVIEGRVTETLDVESLIRATEV